MALFLLAAWASANATEVRIDAELCPDLTCVRGTIRADPESQWTDSLALLPEPPNDTQSPRTYPGRSDKGHISWFPLADGHWHFVADLPRRFGDIGTTRHGLFANGGWYPQPVDASRLPSVDWHVSLRLPPDVVGVLGDQAGTDHLTWQGRSDRVSIAAMENGVLTQLQTEVSWATLLTRRRPRRALTTELTRHLAAQPFATSGVIVEAPLRRRLARPGVGVTYVSDRAYRLTPGFRSLHRDAVAAGLAASTATQPHTFDRAVTGVVALDQRRDVPQGQSADRFLRTLRWIPQINAILTSGSTPFFGELLDRTFPTDPVRDDLAEMLAPSGPARAFVAQARGLRPEAGDCMWPALSDGASAIQAAMHCQLPPAWANGWLDAYPEQDYRFTIDPEGVVIQRDVDANAAPELFDLRIDREDVTVLVGPGSTRVPTSIRAQRVVLDPYGNVQQHSRAGDRKPTRWDPTLAAWIYAINVSQGRIQGAGWLTLRQLGDTRNFGVGTLSNSTSNLASATIGYLRREGPLKDGIRRPHGFRLDFSGSVLNAGFADTQGQPIGLDVIARWTHDTQVDRYFPLRGHRVGVAVSAGGIPGTSETWRQANAFASGLVAVHPRLVLAGRVTAATARSDRPHRRLSLGGPNAIRSIADRPACTGDPAQDVERCSTLATERLVTTSEIRWAPLRHMSIPAGIGWATEFQVATGMEAVYARTVDQRDAWEMGLTVGLFAIGDAFGAEPKGAGITLAWPWRWHGLAELQRTAIPEVYIRFDQAF